jgi:hypothetical protein
MGRVVPAIAVAVPVRKQARFDRRGHQRFEVAATELGVGILAGDDLALLGDADRAVHAARRLGEDRFVTGPTAATDAAATAVKEPQLDIELVERLDQLQLGTIERPVGGDKPSVLVAVRIAEHHFLPSVAAGEPALIGR